jgi:hypothetical protein
MDLLRNIINGSIVSEISMIVHIRGDDYSSALMDIRAKIETNTLKEMMELSHQMSHLIRIVDVVTAFCGPELPQESSPLVDPTTEI